MRTPPAALRVWQRLGPCLLLSVCLLAQASARAEPLSLQAALARSLDNNPQLRLFAFRHSSLAGEAQMAAQRPALQLGAEVENFAGSGEFRGTGAAELELGLSSVIELGDKRGARVGVANARRAALDAQQQAAALDLLGEVTRRFVDLLAAQEQQKLALEAEALARDTLQSVRRRAQAGATPQAEIDRARAALHQSQLARRAAEHEREVYRRALAELWGDTTPDFERVRGELYRFASGDDFADLYARAEANPSIEAFAARERLREAELRLSRRNSSSDFAWSLGVRRLQESEDDALVAGLSVPLFSGRRNQGAVQAATAARDQVAVEREAALLALHTQLFRAYSRRQQAMEAVETLRDDIIPLLEQSLSSTREAYLAGSYNYQQWADVRQELLEARRQLIQQARSVHQLGADIEQLSAEPLSAQANKPARENN